MAENKDNFSKKRCGMPGDGHKGVSEYRLLRGWDTFIQL